MSDKNYIKVSKAMTDEQHAAMNDLYMSGTNHDGHTWVTFSDIEATVAKLLKDQEYYRWHDLRKDPDDVPAYGTEIVYLFRDDSIGNVCSNTDKYDKYTFDGFGRFTYIAWKYLEEFDL